MTKDNWLTVAMIIAVIITAAATLLGPVLAVIVQVRMSQPTPTPTTSQPKEPSQWIHSAPTLRFLTLVIDTPCCWVLNLHLPSTSRIPETYAFNSLGSTENCISIKRYSPQLGICNVPFLQRVAQRSQTGTSPVQSRYSCYC